METTYLLSLTQTHAAVERFSADSVATLRCKPGYEQRGAVCQPIKQKGGDWKQGLLKAAGVGAGTGVLKTVADQTMRNMPYGSVAGRVLQAGGAKLGADVAGGDWKQRLAGAAVSGLTSEVVSRLGNYLAESARRGQGARQLGGSDPAGYLQEPRTPPSLPPAPAEPPPPKGRRRRGTGGRGNKSGVKQKQ